MNNFLISPINNVNMQIDLKTKQNKISNSYLKHEDDLHLATMKANKKRLISQHFINSNHNQNLALINNDAFDCRKENHIGVLVISALSGDYIQEADFEKV
ncbi:hypothetical protein [Campylobacter felis]|nr:hypothetical protein [Campylobacter felis]MDL0110883.1 hypothetical protein [Campylobacter felis]